MLRSAMIQGIQKVFDLLEILEQEHLDQDEGGVDGWEYALDGVLLDVPIIVYIECLFADFFLVSSTPF